MSLCDCKHGSGAQGVGIRWLCRYRRRGGTVITLFAHEPGEREASGRPGRGRKHRRGGEKKEHVEKSEPGVRAAAPGPHVPRQPRGTAVAIALPRGNQGSER